MKLTTLLGTPLACASFALLAPAQQDLFTLSGLASGDRFGSSVAGGFDVDGDLVPDSLVGAPYEALNGPMSGAARVFSGSTGAELLALAGDSALDMFGSSVALGDLDGDGRAELIVGAYGDDANGADSGTVYVHSGLDGSLLYTRSGSPGDHLGFALSYVPDVNGDGFGDFIAGARAADVSASNAGAALLYSGIDGALLRQFDGEAAYDLFGSAVAGTADLDGDGRGDVVVGAYLNDANGAGAGGAYVYSGATGVLLHTLRGQAAGDALGFALADAGDVDGDGASDVLVGAPSADSNGQNAGRANLYSGATGALLQAWSGDAAGDNFGSAVAGRLQIDGDAFADVMVGALANDANGTSAGLVRVFAGVDGSELATLQGAVAGARLGAALASAGDADLDGRSELLLGAWGEDGGAGALCGTVHVLTFSDPQPLISNYCVSSFNSGGMAADISAGGTSSLAAADLELVAGGIPAGQPGLFYYGANQVQVPFGDGFRCVGGQIFRLDAVLADAGGQARQVLDYAAPPEPAGQITAGSQWNFQFWYRDPGSFGAGFNLTNGLAVDFVP